MRPLTSFRSEQACFLGDISRAEFAQKKEKRRSGDLARKSSGALQIGGGILLGKAALDSGLPRLAGVRLERHGTSKASAKKILESGGYLDPSKGGGDEGFTKKMRLDAYANNPDNPLGGLLNDLYGNTEGHVFVSGVNPSHPNWPKRNIFSPVKDVLQRKVMVAGYRGVHSGPLTDREIAQAGKDVESPLFRNFIKTMSGGEVSDRKFRAGIRNLRNPKRKEGIAKAEKHLAKLKKGLEQYDSFDYNPKEARARTQYMKQLSKVENLKMQQSIAGYFDLMIAQGKKLVKSPPYGFLGVGRELYVPGSDEFFNDPNRFVFDPDDPFRAALKSKQKVKVFGNRYSATAHAIKQHGLLNLIKSNPKRVAAGGAILLGGGLLAGQQIKSGVRRLRSGSNQQPQKSAGNKVKVKGFLRRGRLVKGYTRDKGAMR